MRFYDLANCQSGNEKTSQACQSRAPEHQVCKLQRTYYNALRKLIAQYTQPKYHD